jgi:hypothetical protein
VRDCSVSGFFPFRKSFAVMPVESFADAIECTGDEVERLGHRLERNDEPLFLFRCHFTILNLNLSELRKNIVGFLSTNGFRKGSSYS